MKFAVSAVAMAVMSLLLGFLIHATLLAPDYAKLAGMFRPPAEQGSFFGYMLIAHLLIGIGFTWIYLQGREDKAFLAQGIRFGLAVAVLATIPTYLIYYAVQPYPAKVVVKQIVFDTIGVVLMGIVCAWINRVRVSAAAAA
ncbi:MAG: hypothetical protein GZ089_12460 [Aromatoleum sp.]|nr:hypothetical protein [Aromatoleum sp.]